MESIFMASFLKKVFKNKNLASYLGLYSTLVTRYVIVDTFMIDSHVT